MNQTDIFFKRINTTIDLFQILFWLAVIVVLFIIVCFRPELIDYLLGKHKLDHNLYRALWILFTVTIISN